MQFAASFVCCLLVASSVAFAKIQSHSEEFNLSCENGGSIKQSKCVCDRRFEGEHCEIEPCLNGGVKGHDGKCHCPFGLTGERCEKVTHCTDNGVLVNGTCKCEQRWGGIFCNVRTCHNGISVGAENSFCFCDLGFTGPFCDEELKCEHGTVTQNNQCECDPNWIGADCNQCAESFYQYNNECIELKPKNAQPILHSKQVPLTPILIVGGACFLLVIGVGVTLFYVMKRRTKHSPISSERASATDV